MGSTFHMNRRISLALIGILGTTGTACAKTGAQTAAPQAKALSKEEATALVKPFYDFLGGDATPGEVQPSYHEDWISYYDNDDGRTMEDTLAFVSGPLAQMVPDLKWRIVDVYVTNANEVIVRGEATGTPVGDVFMGRPLAGGKSFKIMSVDVHVLEGRKIKATYHVEDWLNAIGQVAASSPQ